MTNIIPFPTITLRPRPVSDATTTPLADLENAMRRIAIARIVNGERDRPHTVLFDDGPDGAA